MGRLIDADSLKAEIAKRTPHFVQRIKFTPCFEAIRDAKTVDAVEVVRCKSCKWWFMDKKYDGLYRCANDGLLHKPDWFCADGERRENE